ncbi:type III secretion system stalk subunit SctO [Desulfocurvus sp. DL9XJH121]
MIYPLHILLHVRGLRQDKALRNLTRAERDLAEARKALAKARQRHRDYLDWLAEEEERRYASIMRTDMSLEDVEDFKLGLCSIRGMEAGHLERILRAEKDVEDREEDCRAAKALLLEAQRATMKIETHKARWMELARKEAERLEEVELEDFIPQDREQMAV